MKQSVQNKKAASSFAPSKKSGLFFRAFVQPKLTIGASHDRYEQEADTMADRVMQMSDHETVGSTFFKPAISSIQRKCDQCEEEEKHLQKKGYSDDSATEANREVQDVLSSSKGQLLDAGTRDFMEQRFNYDFSGVKIHNDQQASRGASAINALANTSGNNMVLNAE